MGHYQDALDYIFSYVNYERQARYTYDAVTFNLGRMTELLNGLDRPQDKFSSVHIAGTKGKGSTSAMVESVLRAAGYRTGLYTSPHLHTFRERIRMNGELISKAELVDIVSHIRPAIEAVPGLTAFEIMTALGFVYFAERQVEWAVLEVGLGGRLDATNVVRPAVCGITPLSYDHIELLGHTLSLIAWEKAGIIKRGVPLVSAPQDPEALAVIEQVCAEIGARLVLVGRDWHFDAGRRVTLEETGQGGGNTHHPQNYPAGQTLTVRRAAERNPTAFSARPASEHADDLILPDLYIPLLGHHQLVNATTAVAILAELNAQGVTLTEDALRKGLADTRWPGRFEVLLMEPILVVDSAHNGDSACKLRAALDECFPPAASHKSPAGSGKSAEPGRRLALVFGASADKDIAGMLEIFLDVHPAPDENPASPPSGGTAGRTATCGAPVAKVIVTRSGHPRSADPHALAEQVRALKPDCPISIHDDVGSALDDALNWARPNDIICVTGSIFVVAQARRVWALRHPKAFRAGDWVYQDETAGEVVPDDDLVEDLVAR